MLAGSSSTTCVYKGLVSELKSGCVFISDVITAHNMDLPGGSRSLRPKLLGSAGFDCAAVCAVIRRHSETRTWILSDLSGRFAMAVK
jgi:hypothetical protein